MPTLLTLTLPPCPLSSAPGPMARLSSPTVKREQEESRNYCPTVKRVIGRQVGLSAPHIPLITHREAYTTCTSLSLHTQGGIYPGYTYLHTHREAYTQGCTPITHTGRHIPGYVPYIHPGRHIPGYVPYMYTREAYTRVCTLIHTREAYTRVCTPYTHQGGIYPGLNLPYTPVRYNPGLSLPYTPVRYTRVYSLLPSPVSSPVSLLGKKGPFPLPSPVSLLGKNSLPEQGKGGRKACFSLSEQGRRREKGLF